LFISLINAEMKRALLTFFVLTAISTGLFSQKIDFGKTIVAPILYANFQFFDSKPMYEPLYDDSRRVIGFEGITIGAYIKNPQQGWGGEIELAVKTKNEIFQEPGIKEEFIGIRAEYSKHDNIALLGKQFLVRLGFSGQGFKFYERYIFDRFASPSDEGIIQQEKYGLIFSIVPHLEVPLNQRLFLDINVPLFHTAVYYKDTFFDQEFKFNFMGEHLLRIGAGIKL